MAKCIFSGLDADSVLLANHDGHSFKTPEFGEYWITNHVWQAFSGKHELSKKEKLLCLQEIANLSAEGLITFWTLKSDPEEKLPADQRVVIRAIDSMSDKKIEHQNKDIKILRLLSEKLKNEVNPFDFTNLNINERYRIGIFEEAEYGIRIGQLVDRGLVSLSKAVEPFFKRSDTHGIFYSKILSTNTIGLTVKGWDYVYQFNYHISSSSVFIAMAFTDNSGAILSPALRDKIKLCIEDSGFNAIIVDEVEHNDGIMDKVIASINQSKFVIAELSHHKRGVYYEAGYAKGLGLQVIHVVSRADLKDCHFDVMHLNLIVWDDLEDLYKKLSNRIIATSIPKNKM